MTYRVKHDKYYKHLMHYLEHIIHNLTTLRNITLNKDSDIRLPTCQQAHVLQIVYQITAVLQRDGLRLQVPAPINVVGDLNGQLFDLLRIFQSRGWPSSSRPYLFLGNYVCRGRYGLQIILLLFCLKIKNNQSIFLLRGNNECVSMTQFYGFKHQCDYYYSQEVYAAFITCFFRMPVIAVIQDRIFCVHGGPSPVITQLEQLDNVQDEELIDNHAINDLIWSDYVSEQEDWEYNMRRKMGFIYGHKIVEQFLEKNQFQMMIRSNEYLQQGYTISCDSKLITIFSSPNYLDHFHNKGCVLTINQSLQISFFVLKPKDIPPIENPIVKQRRSILSQDIKPEKKDDTQEIEKKEEGHV